MNKLLWKAIAGWLLLVGAAQADMVAPDALIKDTALEVIAIVKQDPDIKAGNQKKVLALVDAKVLPNFDFNRMTQLAAGKYWRQATPDQKKALVAEFRNMLVRTYTKAFTLYRDQTIEVKPLKLAAEETEATVKTRIIKTGGQPTSVDYQMKKSDEGWKVFDVAIEGVSMVTSYRGTFASQIEQSGIDALIKTLADMNADATSGKVHKADAK
ncbi:MAG: ABC transporter substrate-binding protein [Gallionella sp.]|jgi:phospholipid transport system substrate-binding protein